MGVGFDQWYANPYTAVLLKSIAEDYVPITRPHDASAGGADDLPKRYVSDMEDTLRQISEAVGLDPSCPDADMLIATVKRIAASVVEVADLRVADAMLADIGFICRGGPYAGSYTECVRKAFEDAARWRYIRNDGLIWRASFLVSDPGNTEVYSGEKADAVVDRALSALPSPPKEKES
jgi:hypothetical protein